MVFDSQMINPVKQPLKTGLVGFAIDASVSHHDSDPVERLLENILIWSEGTYGADTLAQAKEGFFQRTGKAFHDDDFFNLRMRYFNDCFIFEWHPVLKDGTAGPSPYAAFRTAHPEAPSEIVNVRHSIFRVTKISKEGLVIEDCLTQNKIKVQERFPNNFLAIKKGDTFQGFIYVLGERNLLSNGLIFHPADAYKYIKSLIKRAKKAGTLKESTLIYEMAKTQLRFHRHPHVRAKIIYSQQIL